MNISGGGATWTNSDAETSTTICYYEPAVHDHELWFLIGSINLFVMLPICLVGTLVNVSGLVCLYRPPKITSGVFVYLKALLCLDIAQLCVTTISAMLPQICQYHHQQSHLLYNFCTVHRRFLEHLLPRFEATVNTMHIWTIAALAAHRYWKISRPVVSRLHDTVSRAQLQLIVLLLSALLFRLPTFLLELQLLDYPIVHINRVPWNTQILSVYRLVYHSLCDPLFANVIPFVWMAIFSLLTLSEICRSSREFHYNRLKIDAAASTTTNGKVAPSSTRRRSDGILGARRQQEWRATISIILIIALYLVFHALQLFNVGRKWHLVLVGGCPTRADWIISHFGTILSMVSASVNAFVFIAFTNRVKRYVQLLIRKTSRNLSNGSSDVVVLAPPGSIRNNNNNNAMATVVIEPPTGLLLDYDDDHDTAL